MKLYGTITSERASKGQGGNKELEIIIQVGDSRKTIARLLVMPNPYVAGAYFINLYTNGKLGGDGMTAFEFRDVDKKGEKKKGEHAKNHIGKLHDQNCVDCRKDNGEQ